ncbi:MAG: hypothetical protein AAF456_07755 [Planctomycetota bacterium]
MATADLKRTDGLQTEKAPDENAPDRKPSYRLDQPGLFETANDLLRAGLNRFQLQLNSALIDRLESSMATWVRGIREEIETRIQHVPEAKRDKWLRDRLGLDRRSAANRPARLVCDFLFHHLQQIFDQLEELKRENQEFRKQVARAHSDSERERIIIRYAERLGADSKELNEDRKAFARWFDEEAVTDRYLKKSGQLELMLTFVIERVKHVVVHTFRLAGEYHSRKEQENGSGYKINYQFAVGIWQRLNLETRLQAALGYEADARVVASALNCLHGSLKALPEGIAAECLDQRASVFINRASMDTGADVWVQAEALSILTVLSRKSAMAVLVHRLANPGAGADDIFVRRHIWKLFKQMVELNPDVELEFNFEAEESPFVRQQMAEVAYLSSQPGSGAVFRKLALQDEEPTVRAAALLAGVKCELTADRAGDLLKALSLSLKFEPHTFVVRTALHVAINVLERAINRLSRLPQMSRVLAELKKVYQLELIPLIRNIQFNHNEIPVRRRAAQAVESIRVILDDRARELVRQLRPRLQNVRPGGSVRLPKKLFNGFTEQELGRIFAVIASDDFGYDLHPGWFSMKVVRGPVFGFRLWRFYFEFTNTATDKRQALRHTVGRVSNSAIRIPSQILGELSETKVPGEPLTIGDDGTWRPFLPLPDDFVSVLNMGWTGARTVRFFTCDGITSVRGPQGIINKVKAFFALSFRFSKLASMRNWNQDTFPASSYVESMRGLGFRIDFEEYKNKIEEEGNGEDDVYHWRGEVEQSDSSIAQFFSSLAAITLPFAPVVGQISQTGSEIWKRLQKFTEYFVSPFENSLDELVIFALLVSAFFLGRHLYSNYTFRRARRRIPFSIGGWGTRGKSGTERLKAALIGVMGHGLVSKTTGCEAMFIQAYPHGEPLEIPLFRPYDKATIWEHRNLIELAAEMDPSVFLWECMALNPGYVDVLQRQWTCDDLATITNTYPDHEDVQGPAGHDVATTISGFVPLNSHLITTEEQMRPYVTESCRLAESTFEGVGWLESGLITEDVLDRFPYREHPDNVALVAKMAEKLGCSYEYSLKAMADYLVPDLGVLKTHPVARVRTREIEFTNGCSANERFGCMGNWKRLGFDKQDPWEEPTTWICGVVNNRADRVPRSKVFARIIVLDVNADRFFLIGNNLEGLQTFIAEAWEEKAATLSLCDQGKPWDREYALATLEQAARDFRQPTDSTHVEEKVECMVSAAREMSSEPASFDAGRIAAAWEKPAAVKEALTVAGVPEEIATTISGHIQELIAAIGEYREMRETISDAPPSIAETVEQKYVATLTQWYKRKIVVVPKYEATGEEVLHRVVEEVPPGFSARVMGLQNIKGTGLDFVYRFQAWDACFEACEAAVSRNVQVAEKGINALVAMPVIGQLCQDHVRKTIDLCRRSGSIKRPDLLSQLEVLESRLDENCAATNTLSSGSGPAQEKDSGSSSRLHEWALECTEQFLDVNDSLRRRDTADVIYRDLAACRISRQRAVVELRKINKRQKGGWLKASRQ